MSRGLEREYFYSASERFNAHTVCVRQFRTCELGLIWPSGDREISQLIITNRLHVCASCSEHASDFVNTRIINHSRYCHTRRTKERTTTLVHTYISFMYFHHRHLKYTSKHITFWGATNINFDILGNLFQFIYLIYTQCTYSIRSTQHDFHLSHSIPSLSFLPLKCSFLYQRK